MATNPKDPSLCEGCLWSQSLSLGAGNFHIQRQERKSTGVEHKAEQGSGLLRDGFAELRLWVRVWDPANVSIMPGGLSLETIFLCFPTPPNLFKNKL